MFTMQRLYLIAIADTWTQISVRQFFSLLTYSNARLLFRELANALFTC